MATDGVKIIDGDTAFDIYGSFMDAYDEGADGAALREMYERDKTQYSFDDCEYEICVTVYALALWEVGELTPEILREAEAVAAKGAGAADWAEQVGEKAGKARQKELDKLLAKISKPCAKIRKRKKYRKVDSLIFEAGDVLAFQLPDRTYGMTVVADIMQYRGECDYMLCRTTFNSAEKPTMQSVAGLRICGSLVPSGHNGMDATMLEKMSSLTGEDIMGGALDRIMAEMTAAMPKLKMPWVMSIRHQDFAAAGYAGNFKKLGNVGLRSNCGSSRFAPSYASFVEGFYPGDSDRAFQSPGMPEAGEFTVDELGGQPYQK